MKLQLLDFFNKLTAEQKRLAVLVSILVIALIALVWPSATPATPVTMPTSAPPVPNMANSQKGANMTVNTAHQPVPVSRDPFQPPQDFQPPQPVTPANTVGSNASGNGPKTPLPLNSEKSASPSSPTTATPTLRLTGIASNGDKQIAIIQVNGKSQAYQLYDLIGTQRITFISETAVALTGAGQTQTLVLEQAPSTGGNSRAKGQ